MLIDEDDCPVCEPFDQEWIFTYGDLVTLLLCFFILLFSFCRIDISKFREVANSFKPTPAGSPYVLEGRDSMVQEIQKEVQNTEIGDDASVTVRDKSVVVSFNARAFFEQDSYQLNEKARQELTKFAKLLFLLPNEIQVEGHSDNVPPTNGMSFWELSGLRASTVARFLIDEGLEPQKINVKGFGKYRPQFRNEFPEQRGMNNRVEVVILPTDEE